MSSTHFEAHDGLDRLSSDELEEQAFGPDPTRKRTRRGGSRRWRRQPKPAPEPAALAVVAAPRAPASRPVVTKYCYACGEEIEARAGVCPTCDVRQPEAPARLVGRGKDKGTATLLALLFGGVGAHRFYLGQTKWGVAMLLFCWTLIPVGIGIVDFVRYVRMSDRRFAQRYDGASRTLLVPPREQRMLARPVRESVEMDEDEG
ncbi:TM2 domain-containing protein [Rubrivirga sp. IMCC45206]|uniref:TM2 domain-containing protein n=1 Tax=Rubrivirga sp. IMCC45206 TaxID=3391614 RepID=UPI00398FF48E